MMYKLPEHTLYNVVEYLEWLNDFLNEEDYSSEMLDLVSVVEELNTLEPVVHFKSCTCDD
jgi:hypothetical protein